MWGFIAMRYFIGFLLAILLIIFVIILLFRGGGKPAVTPSTTKSLDSYASTDAEVVMTIDGPITADQTHRAVRITVNRDDASFEQIQGYDGNVTNQQHYANNQN